MRRGYDPRSRVDLRCIRESGQVNECTLFEASKKLTGREELARPPELPGTSEGPVSAPSHRRPRVEWRVLSAVSGSKDEHR